MQNHGGVRQIMNVEFVTHCWKYSRLLCYHLSSFYLFGGSDTTVTIYYSAEDEDTRKMVEFFTGLSGPKWNPRAVPSNQLCRRAIGRNEAALNSKADWLWFADCDYWFGAKLFPSLRMLASVPNEHVLVYPGDILQCSQPDGDKLIDAVTAPHIASLCSCSDLFVPHGFRKAIGGVQVVRGDWARANGYCRGHRRHHRPTDVWARNIEDVTFRQDVGTSGHRVSFLPATDIIRIRHSRRGGYGPDTNN
jgi:hypothetical protein